MGKPSKITRQSRLFAATLCALLCMGQLHAQTITPNPSGATTTYQVHRYLMAEQHLEAQLAQTASPELDALLGEDFVVRGPAKTSFDLSRWRQDQRRRAQQNWDMQGLEVQCFEGLCVVSFERVQKQTGRRQFMVDVWSEPQGRLLSRYESLYWQGQKQRHSRSTRMAPGRKPQDSIRPDGKG